MTDTAPGSRLSPDLPAAMAEPPIEPPAPTPPPAPDAKPKRPTTRAARAAASAARQAQGKTDKAPKGKTPATPRKSTLETRLTGSLVTLGTAITVAGSMTNPAVQADGVAVISHAPAIAAALDKVAANDPKVKAALERMLTAGVWSGLIAACVPLVLTIGANHGAIPASIVGLLGAAAEPQAPAEPGAPAGSVGIV